MGLTYGEDDARGDERLGELILYVASKCTEDQLFGATKLNKILWRSDFRAYAKHGEPITASAISDSHLDLLQGGSSRFRRPLSMGAAASYNG